MNWRNAGGGLGAAIVGAGIAIVVTGGLHRGAAPDPVATGAIVRSYILDHPDLIPEAIGLAQQKQTADLIDANRETIETPFPGAIGGNPKGDVTLVEYFDYACGYCRQSLKDVDRLVAVDPNVRVLYKELPILSDWSSQAAALSLGAAKAGKFRDFHEALYSGAPSAGTAIAISDRLGIDTAAAKDAPDIAREIATNLATAHALHMSGTPTFIVGDQLLSGAVGYDALKDAIDRARAAKMDRS